MHPAVHSSDNTRRGPVRWLHSVMVLSLMTSIIVVTPQRASALVFTVSFQAATSSFSEAGSHDVTVVLNTGGATSTGAITVAVTNAGTGTAAGTDFSYTSVPLTFPPLSGDGATVDATFTITPDTNHESNETINFGLAVTDPGVDAATAVAPTSHVVTINDNDPVAVAFGTATSTTPESGTATTTVELTVPGGGNLASAVVVDIIDDGTGTASIPGDYTLTTTSVTFAGGTPDGATRNVNVAIVADDLDESNETIDLSLSVDSGPAVANDTHRITINDNDTAGVTVSTPSVNVTEGLAGVGYTVVLDSQPTNPVTITPGIDTGEVTVTPASRVFNAANWDFPQGFTVTAFNDAVADGTTTDTVSHVAASSDAKYGGITIADVAATINDNDSAGVTLSESVLSITEGTGGDTYTVVLTSAPTDTVTITPTSTNGNVQITPASRNFAPANWDTPKVFTVTVPDDDIAEGARTDTITHAASSPTDTDYDDLAVGSVANTIADDDIAGVSASTSSINVTEGQTGVTYTVVLTSEPTDDVVVSVGNDSGEATVGPGSRTFTPANWDTPRNFTVTAVDDGAVDGTTADTIDHAAASSDSAYDGIAINSIAVTVQDNDVAGVTVSKTSVSIDEDGPGEVYTVVLDSQPTDDVTITPSDTNGEVTIAPPSLTFDSGDWDTPKNFTVSAPDNVFADGFRTDTITHVATSVGDAAYDGISVASVGANVTDDEGPATATIDDVAEAEGDGVTVTYTFTISIDPPAAGATSVGVSTAAAQTNPADPAEYEQMTNRRLAIPAMATSVTIDIDAYGDNLTEADERFRVELVSPAGGLVIGAGGANADGSGRATILNDDATPVGNPDSYNVNEGGTLTTTIGNGVLANDTDADDGRGALEAILVSPPAHEVGGFPLAADGTFTYVHDGSGPASDSFSYRATDGPNQSAITTVSITVDNVAPIVETGSDPAPVAEGVPVQVNATFTDPGLSDTHTATIDWGDGTVHNCPTANCIITFAAGSGTVTRSHAYAATGVYTVTVTVDDGDDSGSDNLTVNVSNADFTVTTGGNRDVDEGGIVAVNASFVDADGSSNHQATIDWGDGTIDDCATVLCTIVDNGGGTGTVTGSHQYRDNGSFTVTVMVTDNSGDEGNGGFTSNVANVAPVASIDGPTSGDEGDLIELDGNRVDPGADQYTYVWQVTRDGEFYAAATTRNLNLIVDDDGVYEYTFVVTDDDGGVSNTATHTVTVANIVPVAEITDTARVPLPDSAVYGKEGTKVKLRSKVVDPGDEVLTYDWKIRLLGVEVASSDERKLNFVPTKNGTYFVSLNVNDGDGGSDLDSILVIINNAAPIIDMIDFDATPAVGAAVEMDVFFSDPGVSDTHVVTVNWGEGSDQTSGGVSPRSFSHTYSSAGTRTASVCVEDSDGSETCESFFVNPGAIFHVDSDFNGDGFEDLPIGVPGEDGSGAVAVLYGSGGGLGTAGDDLWRQGIDGIGGSGEAGDGFGSALAWGDFNLDGFADLAVAAPGEDIGGEADVGSVHVIFGSAAGLSGSGDVIFNQDSFGVAGSNQPGDRFGSSLAVGDFNGDGFADLAIGVPNEDMRGRANVGRIAVLFGSPSGVSVAGDESWDQDTPGVLGANKAGDAFGAALTAGDFNLDGSWEVVVGVPGDDVSGQSDSGSVLVLAGSISGLDAASDMRWHQDTGTIGDTAEPNDEFGSVLAVGDFNGDGRPDLAVGVPRETLFSKSAAGGVAVILAASAGLTDAGNSFWHEDTAGLKGKTKKRDRFGFALTSGDFNEDGRDDLAIGIPYQEVGDKRNAGDVTVLYGSGSGLSAAGDQRWNENSNGIKGRSAKSDHLGWALRALDHDGDGDFDLAIGIPDQNVAGDSNAGAVLVINGASSSGLSAGGDTYWHQDTVGVRESTSRNDRFGRAL